MITKEQLLEFGMKENTGVEAFIFPMEKIISLPHEDPDLGTISLCLSNMRNQTEFAIQLPDGSTIFLRPDSIEDLKTLERIIESWEPNY